MQLLGTNDIAEIAMRKIAAFVHEKRTGDRDAADAMLAVRPAGGNQDVAPSWLVSEAGIYSQSEFRRRERAKGRHREPQEKGDKGAKGAKGNGKTGKNKGGGKGKGGGPAGATTPTQG